MDGFRFLRTTQNKYDIVVSGPTNPWTEGTENLFTKEFYADVKNALSPHGVFLQWFHLYSMNKKIIATVVKNLLETFDHLSMYYISSSGDIAFLNTNSSRLFSSLSEKRSNEQIISESFFYLGVPSVQSLSLLEFYDRSELEFFVNLEREALSVPK